MRWRFNLKEAIEAMRTALKHGYSVKLVINGEFYTVEG